MQNPFGAGTALLDSLLLSVTRDNALSQGHKLVNSFPVAENAQYLLENTTSPYLVKGEAETFQKTVLYAGHPKNFLPQSWSSYLSKALQLDHLKPPDTTL